MRQKHKKCNFPLFSSSSHKVTDSFNRGYFFSPPRALYVSNCYYYLFASSGRRQKALILTLDVENTQRYTEPKCGAKREGRDNGIVENKVFSTSQSLLYGLTRPGCLIFFPQVVEVMLMSIILALFTKEPVL